MGAELFHAGGRADGHDEVINCRFSQYCLKRPNMDEISMDVTTGKWHTHPFSDVTTLLESFCMLV